VRKGICGIVVVLVGLLGLQGCGGGDSSISKAEYAQQLELACNKGLREREEFVAKLSKEDPSKSSNPRQQAANIRGFVGVYVKTTEEIADIGLPEQGEKKAEEFVQAREDAAAKVESDPLSALANAPAIFAKANKIAAGLEVASCAK